VPYLVDDTGVGMEGRQLICAFLDDLDRRRRPDAIRDRQRARPRPTSGKRVARKRLMGAIGIIKDAFKTSPAY
jgi:hypothetical protein